MESKISIEIIIGPSHFFRKKINLTENSNKISLGKFYSDLVRLNNDSDYAKLREFDVLYCEAEGYSGATDYGLTSVIDNISTFNFKKIIFHNPPDIIKKKVFEYWEDNGLDKNIYKYTYKNINLNYVKKIESNFDKTIVGQELIKDNLIRIISRNLIYKKKKSKITVVMLYGSSGVGKTETVKFLGDILGENICRIQMSMYQNNSDMDYIYGSTHEKPSFARHLLLRESNIILLDEFDKVFDAFYNAFYQFFDEGIFVDKNYSIDLRDTIIFCTSNFLNKIEIEKRLGAPIFSRFDSVLKFSDLSYNSIMKIADNYIDESLASLKKNKLEYIPDDFKNKILQAVLQKANLFTNVRILKTEIEKVVTDKIISELLKK